MIAFRHADPRYPFLWEDADHPAARWHGSGEGPVHYLADTAAGAWAELIRHEEIVDIEDVLTLRRAIWAVEVDSDEWEECDVTDLPVTVAQRGLASYAACQSEARRLREKGAVGLRAPSAALVPGGATGQVVDSGLRPAAPRDGEVVALFGRRSDLVGWRVADSAHPHPEILSRVRHL